MSSKRHRNRNAEYDMLREMAEQSAAMDSLHFQLDSLTQEGIARVVKRAFESIENRVQSEVERGKA